MLRGKFTINKHIQSSHFPDNTSIFVEHIKEKRVLLLTFQMLKAFSKQPIAVLPAENNDKYLR